MWRQLERLASQPQRWGLTEERLGLRVFVWYDVFFIYFLLSIVLKALRQYSGCGLTAGGGGGEPDHRDDCLFCMTTADNERLDQESTELPKDIMYYIRLTGAPRLCFHTNLRPCCISPHWAAAVWSGTVCRGVLLKWLSFITLLVCSYQELDVTVESTLYSCCFVESLQFNQLECHDLPQIRTMYRSGTK